MQEGGWVLTRSGNQSPLPLSLSPQEPDLWRCEKMEGGLESGSRPGVPGVTPKTVNTQASSGEKLGWKVEAGSDQSPIPYPTGPTKEPAVFKRSQCPD